MDNGKCTAKALADTALDERAFEWIPEAEKDVNEIVTPQKSFAKETMQRLFHNKLAAIALIYIILMVLAAVIGPMLSPFSYDQNDLANQNLFPGAGHWFGTDNFGRDILTRIVCGARISLTVAFCATLLNLFIGAVYGGISGYLGGNADVLMMRFVEVLNSIPMMLYLILLMIILKPGLTTIILAMSVSGWFGTARMVRGQVLILKNQEFVLACKSLGVSRKNILLRHLLPNCIGIIIVTMTLAVPSAIFTEAFLSYIGLGIPAPQAFWGVLISDAQSYITTHPYQLAFPALAISTTILAFNFLGDGLRNALDPKMR